MPPPVGWVPLSPVSSDAPWWWPAQPGWELYELSGYLAEAMTWTAGGWQGMSVRSMAATNTSGIFAASSGSGWAQNVGGADTGVDPYVSNNAYAELAWYREMVGRAEIWFTESTDSRAFNIEASSSTLQVPYGGTTLSGPTGSNSSRLWAQYGDNPVSVSLFDADYLGDWASINGGFPTDASGGGGGGATPAMNEMAISAAAAIGVFRNTALRPPTMRWWREQRLWGLRIWFYSDTPPYVPGLPFAGGWVLGGGVAF